MFWRLALATCWRLTLVSKNACLAKTGSVFKPFQFSLELFMTILFLSQLKLIQTLHVTLYKLHCCTCSPQNLQEKRSRVLRFIFVSICVGVLIFCYGFVSMFLGLFLFGLFKYCSYANLFWLIDSCIFSGLVFLR